MRANATSFDPAPYLSELALIRKYAAEYGIVAPALNLVPTSTSAAGQSAAETVAVTVPAGALSTVSMTIPDGVPRSTVTIGAGSNAPACAAARPTCVSVDSAGGTVTIDNTGGANAMALDLQSSVDLQDIAGNVAISYAQEDTVGDTPTTPRTIASSVYVLTPSTARDTIGGDNFAGISAFLGNIQTGASLLRFLFGAPGESPEAFSSTLQATGDFDDHNSESVFQRYGKINEPAIAGSLSAADVEGFQKLGRDNITAIIRQIDDMQAQIQRTDDNLRTMSNLHLSETYFSDSVAQLENWYAAASAAIDASPAQWDAMSNAVIRLETIPWHGQEGGKSELYLDADTGPALYRSLSQLVAATSENATSVAASAQIIADNSAQFDELMSSVESTQKKTQALLDAMKGTITTGSSDLSINSDYSKRFATVLANTRADGADPAKIYEAFANPITSTESTREAPAAVVQAFDYRWLAIFLAGSLIGALLVYLTMRHAGRRSRTGA